MVVNVVCVVVGFAVTSVFGASTLPCPITTSFTPCVCTQGIIDCIGHSLTTIPVFHTDNGAFSHLRLNKNNITKVNLHVFAALNVTDIDLSYNLIYFIHDQAFGGISQFVHILNLAHNQLVTLPGALSNLEHLVALDVSWNAIAGYVPGLHHRPGVDGLTDDVMRALGDTLTNFKFGSSYMTSWPKSLSHLNQLQELTVAGVHMFYWPPTSFHGFELTLKKLFIQDMFLGAVPVGLDYLRNLEELHMDNLQEPFGDDSMISLPFGKLNGTLKVLSLKNDQLTYFPEGIKDLSSLTSLNLDGNNLQFVSDEAIELLKSANVTSLSLRNCSLKRVPGAISDLRNLQELDLSDNIIKSLESTDLQHLINLRTLKLSHNPLKYMSDNSLCGLENLQSFELVNTSLTEMSSSFKYLSHLRKLDMRESKIDCTCELTWMKYWMDTCMKIAQKPTILGSCETIDKVIMDYIDERIIYCPGYNLDYMSFICQGCTGK